MRKQLHKSLGGVSTHAGVHVKKEEKWRRVIGRKRDENDAEIHNLDTELLSEALRKSCMWARGEAEVKKLQMQFRRREGKEGGSGRVLKYRTESGHVRVGTHQRMRAHVLPLTAQAHVIPHLAAKRLVARCGADASTNAVAAGCHCRFRSDTQVRSGR